MITKEDIIQIENEIVKYLTKIDAADRESYRSKVIARLNRLSQIIENHQKTTLIQISEIDDPDSEIGAAVKAYLEVFFRYLSNRKGLLKRLKREVQSYPHYWNLV